MYVGLSCMWAQQAGRGSVMWAAFCWIELMRQAGRNQPSTPCMHACYLISLPIPSNLMHECMSYPSIHHHTSGPVFFLPPARDANHLLLAVRVHRNIRRGQKDSSLHGKQVGPAEGDRCPHHAILQPSWTYCLPCTKWRFVDSSSDR